MDSGQENGDPWFGPGHDIARLGTAGAKLTGGGTHLSKTIMLADLTTLLDRAQAHDPRQAILDDNILGKRTQRARKVSLYFLDELYGIQSLPPLCAAFLALWQADPIGRPLLALLCALARDPALRAATPAVLTAPIGTQVRWPMFAAIYEARYPARLGTKMLKSMAQNCASSFTQAGFLRGKLAKIRVRPDVSPQVAAFAALIAESFGFGGPALLASPWLAILDVPEPNRIALLQAAASLSLLRIRTGGGMVEVAVHQRMGETLGIQALGDV